MSSIALKHKAYTQIAKPFKISLHISGKKTPKTKTWKTFCSTSHTKLSYTDEKEGTQYNIYKYTHQVKETEKNPDPEWAKQSMYLQEFFN